MCERFDDKSMKLLLHSLLQKLGVAGHDPDKAILVWRNPDGSLISDGRNNEGWFVAAVWSGEKDGRSKVRGH